MGNNDNKLSGYTFEDSRDYKEAKREMESVEYIRANTDLNDINKVLKLYVKLVERKTLKSVVGIEFLVELRNKILSSGIVTKDNLPGIRIEKPNNAIRVYDDELEYDQEKAHLAMIEDYRIKLKNSRIISGFLIAIIVVMLLISIFMDRSMYSIYENKVIDKYEAWQQELDAREAALEELENADQDLINSQMPE
jgi:hypothetical protein